MAAEQDILEFASEMRCQELHMVTDKKTNLKAVIAIHSTKLGPSLGGCRCIEYPSTNMAAIDAIRLAQGMSYKSALAGLPLGGGKAVLLKPKTEIKRKPYFEAFGEFVELLGGRYITAVDSGTSIEDMDVVSTRTSHVTSTSYGEFSLADPSPMTALGVFHGIRAAIKFHYGRDDLEDIHVAVQGVGHVGYSLVQYLRESNARVTIYDVNTKTVKQCIEEYGVQSVSSLKELLTLDCDVFAPCALGGVLNQETIPQIKAHIIAGGANNQLTDPEADSRLLQKRGVLYAPDFVINAGGIIYVCGQQTKSSELNTRKRIDALYDTLLSIYQEAKTKNVPTYDVAYHMAWKKLHEE